jgi:hypothetical protein
VSAGQTLSVPQCPSRQILGLRLLLVAAAETRNDEIWEVSVEVSFSPLVRVCDHDCPEGAKFYAFLPVQTYQIKCNMLTPAVESREKLAFPSQMQISRNYGSDIDGRSSKWMGGITTKITSCFWARLLYAFSHFFIEEFLCCWDIWFWCPFGEYQQQGHGKLIISFLVFPSLYVLKGHLLIL